MDGRIGRLHNCYRVTGSVEAAAQVTARLDRLARERLPEQLAEALDLALGDDPAVYVVRHLDIHLALRLDEDVSDGRLAADWARGLAIAIVRAIARRPALVEIIRFDDPADYIARFVTDLAGGAAWERWYYHPFEAYRSHRSLSEAVRDMLLDHDNDLPQILALLRRCGSLGRVLAALEPAALRRVWLRLHGADPRSPPEEVRPLLALAVRLLVHLDLWAGPPAEIDLLWAAYVATAPAPADWRDRRSLTEALLAVLRFLSGRGAVRPTAALQDDILAGPPLGVLAELDWLDLDALRLALATWTAPEVAFPGAGPPLPSGPTPRQADLLGELLTLVRHGGIVLDRARPDDPANGLALFAALAAHAPRWADDPLVPALIERLLSAWAAKERGGPPASDPTGELARLVPDAADLVEALSGGALGSGATRATEVLIETDCAGVLLLLRAIQDLRLPTLVTAASRDASETPLALDALLLTLGFQWAGPAGVRGGQFDPALVLLAGLEEAPEPGTVAEVLGEAAPESCSRFGTALVRQLAGLHVVGEEVLYVCTLDGEGGTSILVAGDREAGPWPLGRVVPGDDEIRATLEEWRDLWDEAMGCRPSLVPGSEAILRETLAAVGHGWMGRPAADLLSSLTAIAVLRVWARWLRRFDQSSCPYLLTHFLRRPGRFLARPDEVLVQYEPRPLDIVLEMSGYFDQMERVSWLGGRRVRFQPM
jgi:hypothetical protein